MEKLIDKCPQVPMLWNQLAIASQSAGRLDDYKRIAEETYRRYPDSWFGFVMLAMLRLDQERAADVTAMLAGKLTLQDLQHGRLSDYISEVLACYLLMVRYHIAIGRLELAGRYLDGLEQLEPDHSITEQARAQMLLAMSEAILREL